MNEITGRWKARKEPSAGGPASAEK